MQNVRFIYLIRPVMFLIPEIQKPRYPVYNLTKIVKKTTKIYMDCYHSLHFPYLQSNSSLWNL